MCVIAYKAKDVRFPSDKNIEEMWEINHDGAGVMWRDSDGLVHYKKGFMKLKDLKSWISKNKSWLEEVECALHFRITTHGGTSKGNCHPFVVDVGADPHALNGTANKILMHNGMLPLKPRANDISDSAELALRLSTLACPRDSLKAVNETLSGNRIILMDESGTYFFGDEFKRSNDKENEGILYSNLNWELIMMNSYYNSKYNYGVFYDKKDGVFKSRENGLVVPLDEIYPDELDKSDYQIWFSMMCENKNSYGLTKSEYAEILDEAYYNGMTVDEYIEWIDEQNEYEDSRESVAV